MSSARSARSCTSRGFVDPALVSSTTVDAVLGVISRGRPRSQMMCMAFPVENLHFRHHNRTRVSLEVRHFMFCRRLEDFACFRRCERPRHDALLLAVAVITCSLKNARALAEASRDGVFSLAHAKSSNAISNVAGFMCSIVFSIESRPKIDGRPSLSAPPPPPSNAVASP